MFDHAFYKQVVSELNAITSAMRWEPETTVGNVLLRLTALVAVLAEHLQAEEERRNATK